MYYADTHIHLQDYNPADVKNVVTNALKNNVSVFVNASAHPNDWSRVLDLAAAWPQIIPALGVHPWYLSAAPKDWAARLEEQLQQNPRLWVGECGIDRLKNPDITAQVEVVRTAAALAKKYGRPLILHAVKADEAFRPLLPFLPAKTIFHSFTGSLNWGQELQKHGFYLGLNFSLLRKKNYVELLLNLNPHLLLLETDGPYQSGRKDTPSLPANLPLLAAELADALPLSTTEFSQLIYQNWLTFKGE